MGPTRPSRRTLAPEFAAHPDLLARQRREARLLAALNHPNVGALYGPAQSPDGRRIAFSRLFETNPKLGITASDGSGEVTPLTEGNAQDPEFCGSWSLDGRFLVCARGDSDPSRAARIGGREDYRINYAITPDGETCVALRPLAEPRESYRLGVVTGWTKVLER